LAAQIITADIYNNRNKGVCMISNITKILAYALIGVTFQAMNTGIMLQTQHTITATQQIIVAILSLIISGLCIFISIKTQRKPDPSFSQKTADWDLDTHFKSSNHSLDIISDIQKFINLYRQFGIILTPETHKNGSSITIAVPKEKTNESKIKGWDGFYTTLYFNESGKFLYQEIEE
jgi:hypothetical protein